MTVGSPIRALNLFRMALIGCLISQTCQCMAQVQDKRPVAEKQSSPELHRAAKNGNVKMLNELLARGGEINARGPKGETPLMVAIESRQKECAQWLLSKGANPNLQDDNDRSAVSLAAGLHDDSSILDGVLKHGGNPNIVQRKSQLHDGSYIYPNTTPIYDAILAANKRNVVRLASSGAKLDPKIDKKVVSPLGWAIGLSQFEIAYYLIEAGADYRAPSLASDLTIIEALEDFDLSLIGVDELDEQKRKQRRKEQTRWYYRVVKLLREKGVGIRPTGMGDSGQSDRTRNEDD